MASTPPPIVQTVDFNNRYLQPAPNASTPFDNTFGRFVDPGYVEDRRIPRPGVAYADVGAGGAAPPPPPAGSTTGGGSGSGAGPAIDWADVYFGGYGLPAALKTQILELGKKYGTSNPDVFFQSAQNLIRQSDWFKTTFPGFDAGVRAGLYTDETGYRAHLNQLNQVYKQYTGRDVTGTEAAAAFGEGVTADTIGRRFAADAYLKANTNDLQYLSGAFGEGQLSSAELSAYGQEQAGIDSVLGQQIARRLDMAKQRLQGVFSGRLASPGLTLSGGRLQAPGLLGTRSTSDVGA